MLVQLFSSIQFDEKTDQNKYTLGVQKLKKLHSSVVGFIVDFVARQIVVAIGLDWVFTQPKMSIFDPKNGDPNKIKEGMIFRRNFYFIF